MMLNIAQTDWFTVHQDMSKSQGICKLPAAGRSCHSGARTFMHYSVAGIPETVNSDQNTIETASKEDESLVIKYGFSEPLNARCSGIKKGKLNYPTDMLWRPKRVKLSEWQDIHRRVMHPSPIINTASDADVTQVAQELGMTSVEVAKGLQDMANNNYPGFNSQEFLGKAFNFKLTRDEKKLIEDCKQQESKCGEAKIITVPEASGKVQETQTGNIELHKVQNEKEIKGKEKNYQENDEGETLSVADSDEEITQRNKIANAVAEGKGGSEKEFVSESDNENVQENKDIRGMDCVSKNEEKAEIEKDEDKNKVASLTEKEPEPESHNRAASVIHHELFSNLEHNESEGELKGLNIKNDNENGSKGAKSLDQIRKPDVEKSIHEGQELNEEHKITMENAEAKIQKEINIEPIGEAGRQMHREIDIEASVEAEREMQKEMTTKPNGQAATEVQKGIPSKANGEAERELQKEIDIEPSGEAEREIQKEMVIESNVEAERDIEKKMHIEASIEAERDIEKEMHIEASVEAERDIEREMHIEANVEAERDIEREMHIEASVEAEKEVEREMHIEASVDAEKEMKRDMDIEASVDAEKEIKRDMDIEPSGEGKREIKKEIYVELSGETETGIQRKIVIERSNEAESNIQREIDIEVNGEAEIEIQREMEVKPSGEAETKIQIEMPIEPSSEAETDFQKEMNIEPSGEAEREIQRVMDTDSNAEAEREIQREMPVEPSREAESNIQKEMNIEVSGDAETDIQREMDVETNGEAEVRRQVHIEASVQAEGKKHTEMDIEANDESEKEGRIEESPKEIESLSNKENETVLGKHFVKSRQHRFLKIFGGLNCFKTKEEDVSEVKERQVPKTTGSKIFNRLRCQIYKRLRRHAS